MIHFRIVRCFPFTTPPVARTYSSDFVGVMFSKIKCQILLVYLLFVSYSFTTGEMLHRFMDENELNYYFETNDQLNVPYYEVINVLVRPWEDVIDKNQWNKFDIEKILYNRSVVLKLTVFDNPIFLKMQINENLASPLMQVKRTNGDKSIEITNGQHRDCHYIYKSASVSAALSNCHNIGDFVRNLKY